MSSIQSARALQTRFLNTPTTTGKRGKYRLSRSRKQHTSKQKLGVRVSRDGGLSGRVRPGADGKMKLPGGLTLQAPPRGGLATHLLAPNKLLVLTTDAQGLVSLKTKNLGVALDSKKATLKGSVLPTEVGGQKMVELPVLGKLPVPQPGLTNSYMMSEDKLLSLKHEADGTVTVDTKTLGLETDKKGNFKGYVLPDAEGKVTLGGEQLDVSGLKPGKTLKKTIKLNGKKFKVKLRMNEDGSVTVQGKRKKGFFSKLLGGIGKVLSTIGKFAPFLAAIPGLGWTALVAKGVGLFNAAKGVVEGIKNGNWLGVVTSAASFIGGVAKGALAKVANKVAEIGSFVQTAVHTFTHGLGKGLLQVVSNGANLFAGAAGLLGQKRLASDMSKVANYAGAIDAASHGNLMPAAALVANSWGADLLRNQQQAKEPEYFLHPTVRLRNPNPTSADFAEAISLHQHVTRTGFSPLEGDDGWSDAAPTINKSKSLYNTVDPKDPNGVIDQLRGLKASPELLNKVDSVVKKAGEKLNWVGGGHTALDTYLNALIGKGKTGMKAAFGMLPDLVTTRAGIDFSLKADAYRLQSLARTLPANSPVRAILNSEADRLLDLRAWELAKVDNQIAKLTGFISTNQTLMKAAQPIKNLGDALSAVGGVLAAYEGFRGSTATTTSGKMMDGLLQGSSNYGVALIGSANPGVAIVSAIDSLTGNHLMNGPLKSLSSTIVGMMEMYVKADSTALEGLVEKNRNGDNGLVIQGYTLLGDQLSKGIDQLQKLTDSIINGR